MKKTVLITGGFGFLGGRLGQYLSGYYSVILASRSDQEVPGWLPLSKTINIDWEDKQSLLDACELSDVVIHASGLNAKECHDDPKKALLVNGIYTQRLVDAAVKQGVKKIIYLSTVHVYSDQLSGVISEGLPTCNNHPYATSHVAGEEIVLSAASRGDLKGVVVRIANAFGSPVSKNVNCWMLLVNDFCRQAIVEKSLTLYGDSGEIRDFVTVSDFCAAIEVLVEDENASGNVINIGSGQVCTIGEMANRIQRNCLDVLGADLPIIFKQKSLMSKNSFELQTNYLDSVGFKFANEFDMEIKELIHFCNTNFDCN